MASTLRKVEPLTMVEREGLVSLAKHTRNMIEEDIPGAFVECGVWRGGCSFLMADLLRRLGTDRTVWLFDSFEGLPQPEKIDGPSALAWARKPDVQGYFDNCRATVEEVRSHAIQLGLEDHTRFVKGWFEDTLSARRGEIGPIALLRIDADWHASVKCCLENLYDQISPGGIVLLDDYYPWDGCALALHEFLGGRKLSHRLYSEAGIAYFRKQ